MPSSAQLGSDVPLITAAPSPTRRSSLFPTSVSVALYPHIGLWSLSTPHRSLVALFLRVGLWSLSTPHRSLVALYPDIGLWSLSTPHRALGALLPRTGLWSLSTPTPVSGRSLPRTGLWALSSPAPVSGRSLPPHRSLDALFFRTGLWSLSSPVPISGRSLPPHRSLVALFLRACSLCRLIYFLPAVGCRFVHLLFYSFSDWPHQEVVGAVPASPCYDYLDNSAFSPHVLCLDARSRRTEW